MASYDVRKFYDEVLYSTIKCSNRAGLTSTANTDGIRLLEGPPKSDLVILTVMMSSLTQYPTRGIYHGDPTQLKLRWKNFNMYQKISSYIVRQQIVLANAF